MCTGERSEVRVLVLSPHRDDAAFSCGLLLSKFATISVPVEILNVCTISVYAPYTRLARGADPQEEITQQRAREDIAFTEHLQLYSARKPLWAKLSDLGWKDAPLRHAIPAEEVFAGGAVPADETARLAGNYRSLAPASVVLVPMALGGHLDHRLVRDAAIDAWSEDELVFYEDLPYACRMSSVERKEQTRRLLPWACETARTPPAISGDKRRMALCYGSQIAPNVADEMEDYCAGLGSTERLHGSNAALRMLARLLGIKQMVQE